MGSTTWRSSPRGRWAGGCVRCCRVRSSAAPRSQHGYTRSAAAAAHSSSWALDNIAMVGEGIWLNIGPQNQACQGTAIKGKLAAVRGVKSIVLH